MDRKKILTVGAGLVLVAVEPVEFGLTGEKLPPPAGQPHIDGGPSGGNASTSAREIIVRAALPPRGHHLEGPNGQVLSLALTGTLDINGGISMG